MKSKFFIFFLFPNDNHYYYGNRFPFILAENMTAGISMCVHIDDLYSLYLALCNAF
jgi:hypothetical protein